MAAEAVALPLRSSARTDMPPLSSLPKSARKDELGPEGRHGRGPVTVQLPGGGGGGGRAAMAAMATASVDFLQVTCKTARSPVNDDAALPC